ncbi:UNVERIFIED_CONTAM: hypothetical protein K2H54_006853 [Gekko kuhli]
MFLAKNRENKLRSRAVGGEPQRNELFPVSVSAVTKRTRRRRSPAFSATSATASTFTTRKTVRLKRRRRTSPRIRLITATGKKSAPTVTSARCLGTGPQTATMTRPIDAAEERGKGQHPGQEFGSADFKERLGGRPYPAVSKLESNKYFCLGRFLPFFLSSSWVCVISAGKLPWVMTLTYRKWGGGKNTLSFSLFKDLLKIMLLIFIFALSSSSCFCMFFRFFVKLSTLE